MGMPAPPLVSVVIVNHNYGRFLAEAWQSVRGQSYPEIECVIVDDASTDASADVIAGLVARDPSVKIVQRERNGGQTMASFAGLAVAAGTFVVFLDADDLLLPDCIATHVYVHLSSRLHVGLTCVDMAQCRDGRVVVAGLEAAGQYVMQSGFSPASAFRPVDAAGLWGLAVPGAHVLRQVAYVPPGRVEWCWAPTSGNCYRRDALALLEGMAEAERLPLSTDVLFCAGVSSMTGSLLIDVPLAVYRLHGSNLGTHTPQLDNVRSIRRENEMSRVALRLLAEHLVSRAEEMAQRFWEPDSFLRALAALEATDGVKELVAANHDGLSRAVGPAVFDAWMQCRQPPEVVAVEHVPEPVIMAEPEPEFGPEPVPEPVPEPLPELGPEFGPEFRQEFGQEPPPGPAAVPARPQRAVLRAIRGLTRALRMI
jgi:hypothetical protein